MKELFTEYQQQMTGSNAEFIDDEYHFQKWVEDRENGWTEEMEQRYWAEQCPDPFATPEDLERIYSNLDKLHFKYEYLNNNQALFTQLIG